MRATLNRLSPADVIGGRLRRRAIRRAFAHGALLLIPFTYALVTWLE